MTDLSRAAGRTATGGGRSSRAVRATEPLAAIATALCESGKRESQAEPPPPVLCRSGAPSGAGLRDIVDALRSALFPGYFGGEEAASEEDLHRRTVAALKFVADHLPEQIERGFSLARGVEQGLESPPARELTQEFLVRLPGVQALLATDVQAAFEGDPAATCYEETIECYPGVFAVACYRLAHELQLQGVPLVPRRITELAHSLTGIDIHPGATIGEWFSIDHGTGVVIGETTVIGNGVRMYQGVTLGAISFPMDEQRRTAKGGARHPIVEDDVVIYAGATILGRVTIGRGSIIGGGVWLTHSVAPGTVVSLGKGNGGSGPFPDVS
ncbi:MAG: serine acetyltransferase [Thermotogota bacterium]